MVKGPLRHSWAAPAEGIAAGKRKHGFAGSAEWLVSDRMDYKGQ